MKFLIVEPPPLPILIPLGRTLLENKYETGIIVFVRGEMYTVGSYIPEFSLTEGRITLRELQNRQTSDVTQLSAELI